MICCLNKDLGLDFKGVAAVVPIENEGWAAGDGVSGEINDVPHSEKRKRKEKKTTTIRMRSG